MAEVTRTTWGQNIGKGFQSMLLGIVLFLGSFVVLWFNAGRPDRGKIADTSIQVDATQPNAEVNGQFIALSGNLTTEDVLGDPGYINAGKYISISRSAEMYAWKENVRTETKDEVGGGTTTIKYYSYSTEWTSMPSSSSSFNQNEVRAWERQHNVSIYNPTMTVKSDTQTVNRAKIGVWPIDPQSISLPGGDDLELNEETVVAGQNVQGDYIYLNQGGGSLENPRVGDIRLSFSVLKSDIPVTALGKASGNTITKHTVKQAAKNEVTFYRVFNGTKEDAVSALKGEDKMMGIILIAVGFFMMWIGLSSVFQPLIAILKVLPFLANLGKGVIGAITFAVALVLTLVTVGLFAIFRNIIALIIVLALLVVLFVVLMNKKKQQAAA